MRRGHSGEPNGSGKAPTWRRLWFGVAAVCFATDAALPLLGPRPVVRVLLLAAAMLAATAGLRLDSKTDSSHESEPRRFRLGTVLFGMAGGVCLSVVLLSLQLSGLATLGLVFIGSGLIGTLGAKLSKRST